MAPPALVLEDRYRLDDSLGVGGMGEVWRATDLLLARPVAVKLLRPAYAQDEEGLARFRAEARYAASLSHPNIAHVYDYGGSEPPARPYLVMELVDGPSLAALLADGPLTPGRTLEIIGQAAAGLAAAHAAGLVHRDIKPGNLLISQSGLVKIADFGIAHAVGSAPVTRSGEVIGTPAYLSPEQAAGAAATPASDLYALGIVAYQCLAGKPPFTGEPLAVALAHQEQDLPPLPPGVPPEAGALIAHLAAKDPRARPATAGEVAAQAARLRAVLAGEAVTHPSFPAVTGMAVAPTVLDLPAGGAGVGGLAGRADPLAAQRAGGPAGAGGPATPPVPGLPTDPGGPGWPAPAAADLAPAGPAGPPSAPPGGARPGPATGAADPAAARRSRRLVRAGLVAAAIVVFGLAGWAVSALSSEPAGHGHQPRVPEARPSSPVTGPTARASRSGTPQAPATAGAAAGRPRHSRTPQASPSAPAPSPASTPSPPASSPAASPSSSPPPTSSSPSPPASSPASSPPPTSSSQPATPGTSSLASG